MKDDHVVHYDRPLTAINQSINYAEWQQNTKTPNEIKW